MTPCLPRAAATTWSSPRVRAIAATAFRARPESRSPAGRRAIASTWDEVALDKVKVSGEVLVVDEIADVAAPLTAVKLAKLGAKVRLLTKWPMIGWETAAEVYLHWILTYLYEAEVEMITDHAVKSINGAEVEIANIYQPSQNAPDQRRCDRDGDGALFGERALSFAAAARRERRSDRLRGCAAHGL